MYINFCSKNALGLIFKGCFVLQSWHILVAAQWWRAGLHLTRAYLGGGGRAYITSILKNHTRAYFEVRSYFRGNKGMPTVSTSFNRYKIALWI